MLKMAVLADARRHHDNNHQGKAGSPTQMAANRPKIDRNTFHPEQTVPADRIVADQQAAYF
jgi:hypothetical protein